MFLFLVQLVQTVEKSDSTHGHPLALLAEESKKFLKKDSTMFMPIFSQRHPHAAIFSASLVHKLYGNKLVSLYLLGLCKHNLLIFCPWWSLNHTSYFQKPFLDGAEHLTEDVVSVFPAADSLEEYILSVIMSSCEEETAQVYCRKLIPYEVR